MRAATLAGELLLQREHQVFLGREVQVEQALGDPGPPGDVVQRGGGDALGQEQGPAGREEVGAALFGRLGSGHRTLSPAFSGFQAPGPGPRAGGQPATVQQI